MPKPVSKTKKRFRRVAFYSMKNQKKATIKIVQIRYLRIRRLSMIVAARVSIFPSFSAEDPDEADRVTLKLSRWKLPNLEKKNPGLIHPQAALVHRTSLTDFEKSEIKGYEAIFTVGNLSSKQLDCHKTGDFTEKDGTYKVVPGDHIAYQFDVVEMLGEGTYAQVFECIDKRSQKTVAIKVMKMNKRVYNEARTLMMLNDGQRAQADIVEILNYFHFRKHFFVVMEYYDYDLGHYLNLYTRPSFRESVRMMSSVLNALVFLHCRSIVHGDLKPSNILLDARFPSQLKIADFGLATRAPRLMGNEHYQSRHYRAPEVFCKGMITPAIDMWSFTLIMAEMYLGRPYLEGTTDFDQFVLIQQYLGRPPPAFFAECTNTISYFSVRGVPRHCHQKVNRYNGTTYLEFDTTFMMNNSLNRRLPGTCTFYRDFHGRESAALCDFLKKNLVWEWRNRLIAPAAFVHPLFTNVHMQ